jgi:hypothetical protein
MVFLSMISPSGEVQMDPADQQRCCPCRIDALAVQPGWKVLPGQLRRQDPGSVGGIAR